MRKPKASKRKIYWKNQIQKWKETGLTQKEYCRRSQLNKHTFKYWIQKLKRDAKSLALVPVSLVPETSPLESNCRSGISVTVKNRFEVYLETEFHSPTLSQLISVLETQ